MSAGLCLGWVLAATLVSWSCTGCVHCLGLRPSSLVAPSVPGRATLRLQLFVLGSRLALSVSSCAFGLVLRLRSRLAPSISSCTFGLVLRLRSRLASSVSPRAFGLVLRIWSRLAPSVSSCAFGLVLRLRSCLAHSVSSCACALALGLRLRSGLGGWWMVKNWMFPSCHRGIMVFGLRSFWLSCPLRVLFALNCHPAVWLGRRVGFCCCF